MTDKATAPSRLRGRGRKEAGMKSLQNLPDKSIIAATWAAVKRFAAGTGCIFAALATMLFFCATIENDWSWSGSLALTITAAWLCRMCYKYAAGEEWEGDDESNP